MQRITPPPAVPTVQMEHASGQRTGQSAQVGPVDGLVDRLRAQPSLRLARELLAEATGDLFGTPPTRQLALDPGPQLVVSSEAARSIQPPPGQRTPVRFVRPIST